ncbi:hypothetical protein [Nostoc sp. PCC 7107]|uniref:hypothetical protein n=1 Tax=Nostoc sp. PCC 7107 TaxID=317936 RepID=UPI00029F2087|nr:hypothetical protein [Nostoc sp. PCC 7107]AFY43638.1 hypothetical protein Nos7107_3047 [Nostoc sp. PCC 7107]
MTNNKNLQKTPEQRIEKIERFVDILRWQLINSLEASYALAAELAILKGQSPDSNEICLKLRREYDALNTLRPINHQPKHY